MSERPGPLRRVRILTIPVLLAGMLLMAGAEWWRARIAGEYEAISPPELPARLRIVDAEAFERLSEEQFILERNFFAAQARQRTAEAARRLYTTVSTEAAGAVLCLLGALPWVLSRPQRWATKEVSPNGGDSKAHQALVEHRFQPQQS